LFIKGIEDLVRLVLDLLQILVGNDGLKPGGRMVSAVPLLRFYMISGFPTKHAFPIFDIVVATDIRSGGDYLLAELGK